MVSLGVVYHNGPGHLAAHGNMSLGEHKVPNNTGYLWGRT